MKSNKTIEQHSSQTEELLICETNRDAWVYLTRWRDEHGDTVEIYDHGHKTPPVRVKMTPELLALWSVLTAYPCLPEEPDEHATAPAKGSMH